jgi:hypothetical protein
MISLLILIVQKYGVEEKNGQSYLDTLIKAVIDIGIEGEHQRAVAKQLFKACAKNEAQHKKLDLQKAT